MIYARSLLRLAGVTQVLTPSETGAPTHSRLTHSFKVSQVARSLAERFLNDSDTWQTLYDLGGLDADVVEAASLAHDLGHPPFGHIGEVVLDKYARTTLGLSDGFEGNAQSFRIVTRLEPRSSADNGINGTLATAAAVLKYPWARPASAGPDKIPPKFGHYANDQDAFNQARSWLDVSYPDDAQTLEAALMDLADDITYALHDLEDFRSAGLISVNDVVNELSTWLDVYGDLIRQGRTPSDEHSRWGQLRQRIEPNPRYDAGKYVEAIVEARNHLLGLRSSAQGNWRITNETSRRFVSKMITQLSARVVLNASPTRTEPPADFAVDDWHLVQILKSVTRDRVIARADVAATQRGQQDRLHELLRLLRTWMQDEDDSERAPDELRALHTAYGPRGLLDFVASLSDAHAVALHRALTGEGDQTVLLGLAF